MGNMDKHESFFAAALAHLWPHAQKTDEPRKRTTGEFQPGSLRTLVLLVVASWMVIGSVIWAI
jgi:hypothetical protein